MHRRTIGKPENFGKAFLALLKYCKKDLGWVVFALLLAAVGAVCTILGPNEIGNITNAIKDGLAQGIDLPLIGRLTLGLALLYGTGALCMFLQHYIMATVTQRLSRRMRGEINGKLERIPLSYFSTHTYGDILSRVTNDVDLIGQSLSNSLATVVSSGAQFAGCMIMMFYTNATMAVTSIAATLLGMVLMVVIMGKSQRYFIARQSSLGKLNGYIEEMYHGHDVIRVSGGEAQVAEQFRTLNDAVRDSNFKSQFLSGLMQPLMTFVGNLGYVAVCVVGALLALDGKIEFGVITAFMIYVRLFESPLRQISQSMTNLQSASAASERVFSFLQEEEESEEVQTVSTPAGGEVVFSHVAFSYPDKPEREIIHDFNATVHPGQKVAIVGPTGAGKTTLVNLLMRFFEPTRGEIRVDGIPLTTLTRQQVHSLFGMVLQDTWLFQGTVRENLVFNLPNVTQEQLEQVVQACGLTHFIETLPKQYDTVLSDHSEISQGQKQLLTIARAMLQNNPMLILDEATSSIDTRTELVAQKAMDTLTQGRTSFVIAHRLSTIRNADLILVIRDGDIVEQGTHGELLAAKGFYYHLYQSQFENKP